MNDLEEKVEELIKRDEQLRKIVRKWNQEILSNRKNISDLRERIEDLEIKIENLEVEIEEVKSYTF